MKNKSWQNIVLWAILILSTAWIVFFLVSSRRQHKEETGNPVSSQQDSIRITRIIVDNPTIDFGRVSQDSLLKADITVKNTGNADLYIFSLTSDCTCTMSDISSRFARPEEELTIHIEIDTKNKYGSNTARTTFEANTEEKIYIIKLQYQVKQ